MKIVINTSYGAISDESARLRFDPQFIEDVESGCFVGRFDERFGLAEALCVVEIPDETTSYQVINYDGAEGIAYVVDGQLHWKVCENCRIF